MKEKDEKVLHRSSRQNKTVIPSSRDEVYKLFSHLIPYNTVEIPLEHRYNKKNPHSLRCFRKIYQRNEEQEKLLDLPKVRCKKHAVEGYLFCKYHGGKEKQHEYPVLQDAKPTAVQVYRKIYDADMGDLMEAFLNDPGLLDMKPDLANLRLIMSGYIKKLCEPPKAHGIADFMSRVREAIMDEDSNEEKRFNKIIELAESMSTLTNGRAIDRINRCVESIGKTVDRIKKYETSDSFLLTPEGLKIFLRAMVELLDSKITDATLKAEIRKGLLSLSVKSKGGDVSQNIEEKKSTVVDVETVE